MSREPWLHHSPARSGAPWVGTLLQAEQTRHKSSGLSQIQTIMKLLKWPKWQGPWLTVFYGSTKNAIFWIFPKCRDSLAACWSFPWDCDTNRGVNPELLTWELTEWSSQDWTGRLFGLFLMVGSFFPSFGNTKCCLVGLLPPFFITILRVTLW